LTSLTVPVMIDAANILLSTLSLLTLIPVAVLFTQVLMSARRYAGVDVSDHRRPPVAVLVPAHNEALLIATTLRLICRQLVAGDRLLVVADNCSDDTSAIAVNAGAEVLIRTDVEHRGKGYALDYGVRHLQGDSRDVVIIVDADCEVEEGAIDLLARRCAHTRRPVQALYLMRAPERSTIKLRVAEFAWLVRNKVRPLGYHRLGYSCPLMGTGMAFPWSVISTAALATASIVEDMKLGIALTRRGVPPIFCAQAVVRSVFPATAEGTQSQRTRWEHGHLGMILAEAPSLFVDALRQRDGNLLATALDLCVPPLTLLMLFVATTLAVSICFFVTSANLMPLMLAGTSVVLSVIAVLLAWFIHGQEVISLRSLAFAPVYAFSKIPVYIKFLISRQIDWVRSKRDPN
jgi:cellulose synthase/poly-beta-1,6-N-acetylglucosamine synthase-like glycosyltransferase